MKAVADFFKNLLRYWWVLVLLALGFFVSRYKDFLVKIANNSLDDTKDKSKELEKEKKELLNKSSQALKVADEAKERREERAFTNIDVNWHKDRKD